MKIKPPKHHSQTSLTRQLRPGTKCYCGSSRKFLPFQLINNFCRSSWCTLAIRGNGGLDAVGHGGRWKTFSRMCVQVEPRCWDFSRSGCMASCCTIDIVVLALDAAVPSTTSFDVVHVLIATAGKLAWAFSTIPWPTNLPVVIQVGPHYMPIFRARNGCVLA